MKCEYCKEEINIKYYIVHIRKDHNEQYCLLEEEYRNHSVSCVCGVMFNNFININNFIFDKFMIKTIKRAFHSRECSKNNFISWNSGLTKETDERLKKNSLERIGNLNPIHKVLQNEEAKKEWIKNTQQGRQKFLLEITGKSLEQRYGEEKAKIIKEKQSQSAIASSKVSSNRGMKNKKHTEETKRKISQKTVAQMKDGRINKTSSIQRVFFDKVKSIFSEAELEYSCVYYTIDIAFPDKKLAIEVDGDFWHSNEEKGYKCIYETQKRNKINDTNKNLYLESNNWCVLRFWQSEIEENVELCIQKIKDKYNEL